MPHSNHYIWALIVALIYTGNYNVFGFSLSRTNPSLLSSSASAASSPSSSQSGVDRLESLLASAGNNDDDLSTLEKQISNDDGRKLGHHYNHDDQLKQLIEHSMVSPQIGKMNKQSMGLQHHTDGYIPQTSVLSEDRIRPIYDPGDEFMKPYNSEEPDDYVDAVNVNNDLDINNKIGFLRKLEEEIRDEQDIVSKSALMMQLLEDPSIETLPIVYVEEPLVSTVTEPFDSSIEMNNFISGPGNGIEKRSRYYRRYPWKRHSSRNRGTYEADARYLCVPSKEDVFKLLVGLHENRNGNHHKTVNFCNRKRPAKTIFTNIRFLG